MPAEFKLLVGKAIAHKIVPDQPAPRGQRGPILKGGGLVDEGREHPNTTIIMWL